LSTQHVTAQTLPLTDRRTTSQWLPGQKRELAALSCDVAIQLGLLDRYTAVGHFIFR